MAQLTFIHSTMKSGKSLDLLKTDHAYRERGYKTLLFTSEVDTRYLKEGSLKTIEGQDRHAHRLGSRSMAH